MKEWLTGLLPEDMSRNDVAYELGVTRKTISNMLNPDVDAFGNGFTMLRYLRLVGALASAPEPSRATSRLAGLEEKCDEVLGGIGDILELLAAPRESGANAQEGQ